jgi:hypothetical protein
LLYDIILCKQLFSLLTCNSKGEGGWSSTHKVAVSRAGYGAALGGEEIILREGGKAEAARPVHDSNQPGWPALDKTVMDGGDSCAGTNSRTGGVHGVAANY